jgi:hypothetical protein
MKLTPVMWLGEENKNYFLFLHEIIRNEAWRDVKDTNGIFVLKHWDMGVCSQENNKKRDVKKNKKVSIWKSVIFDMKEQGFLYTTLFSNHPKRVQSPDF